MNKEDGDDTQNPGLNKLFSTGKLLGSLNIDFHQLTGIDNLWPIGSKKDLSSVAEPNANNIIDLHDTTIDEHEEARGGISPQRRIWVKRDGKTPTTIIVSPVMLIDDLKYTIMKNYPTTLAQECDPSELIITANIRHVANNDGTSVLKPDVNIYKFLDEYFPEGMKMTDALTISVPSDKEKTLQDLKQHAKYTERKEKKGSNVHEKDQGQMINLKLRNLHLENNAAGPSTLTEHPISSNKVPPIVLTPKRRVSLMDDKSNRSNTSIAGSQNVNDRFYARNGTQNLEGIKSPNGRTTFSLSAFTNQAGSGAHRRTINDMKLRPNAGISKILSHINVLVVEDNLVNQKIMARHLKSCKVGFKIASNGREALEMWKEGGFHLCFMDIQLPVMSGLEVTREIRRLEKVNHIGNFPTSLSSGSNSMIENKAIKASDKLDLSLFRSPIIIVALTASTGAEDRQEALTAGCNDYLTKPVQLKWLRSKLTEWGCMQALINYDHFRSDY